MLGIKSLSLAACHLSLLAFSSPLALTGCDAHSPAAANTPVNEQPDAGSLAGSVAQKYADYFPIGAAVSDWHLANASAVIERDFNHLTCENAMKAQNIHPSEASYDWAEADRIADFARSHGMKHDRPCAGLASASAGLDVRGHHRG